MLQACRVCTRTLCQHTYCRWLVGNVNALDSDTDLYVTNWFFSDLYGSCSVIYPWWSTINQGVCIIHVQIPRIARKQSNNRVHESELSSSMNLVQVGQRKAKGPAPLIYLVK
jgi:hypothetical protein